MFTYYIVSGGFDPIHEGHIEMIKASAKESDGVIVLVNSDEWLCRKKGKNFQNIYTRKTIIENLKGVIDVLEFDDSDNSASDGIRKVRQKYPNEHLVFANGGDRIRENIPEVPVCQECNVDLVFGVGGENKANSSSWILDNWNISTNKIPVVFITDNNFVMQTSVAITSLIKNQKNEKYDIFIVGANLLQDNINILQSLASKNSTVTIIKGDINKISNLHKYNVDGQGDYLSATEAALLKFDLPNILKDYDKVIYLDGDIIVLNSLKSLYDIDLKNNYVAAVHDTGKIYFNHEYKNICPDYFNSGVMLLNLKLMRKYNLTKKLIETKKNINDSNLMDQNVLNIVFKDKIKIIDIKYNLLVLNLERAKNKWNMEDINNLFNTSYISFDDIKKKAHIIHFSSKDKPWLYKDVPFAKEWYQYFKNSPFKNKKLNRIKKNIIKYKTNYLENIFSVKNNKTKTHKLITILGIKIKIKRKKKINIDVRDKSVLLVEINRHHGECLPGMAKYFIDLGYNVDVLLSNEEAQLNPFSDFKNRNLKIYALKPSDIKEILCSDIMERYDHLYINSNVVKGLPVGEYLGNNIKYPSGKIITLCHDIKSKDEINFNTENASIISLLDFPNVDNTKIRKINTHYFKDMVKHKKNKIVKFIVVGNIEAKRKNHNLLIDAVSQLLSENITNFKIVVVSRIGNLEIPKELKSFFEIKGRLSYEAMYKELEKADFFLTLFDSDNVEHNRYLNTGASGSYQLIYGFNLPCLLPHKFQADINGFNNQNSIGYADNNHFCKAMKTAIQMTDERYQEYKNNLMSLAKEIYKTSLNNLREILDENTNMFPNNLFVSLGVNCFNRVVLTRHHLKNKKSDGEKSLPFDLCVCPLDTMVYCLENDFKDYFNSLKYDKKNNIWKNSKLKISYNHDQDCSSKDKNKLIKRYEDRIHNFRELLKSTMEKVFVISLIQVKEDDDKLINQVYTFLEKKCNSKFKLVVVSIDKNNKIETKTLNKNIYYNHIPHPYPNYWGEWYKGEYFNSPEGKAFEKKYIDFILSCSNKEC